MRISPESGRTVYSTSQECYFLQRRNKILHILHGQVECEEYNKTSPDRFLKASVCDKNLRIQIH